MFVNPIGCPFVGEASFVINTKSTSRFFKELCSPAKLILFCMIFSFSPVFGQTPICSCTPLIYRWRFNFTESCPPVKVNVGPNAGISDSSCKIDGPPNVTNLKPSLIDSIILIELNRNFVPLKPLILINKNFTDGDIVTFESITVGDENIISGGFQVTAIGINSESEQVELNWIVSYSNLCNVSPYQNGNSIGWMVFDNFTETRPQTCNSPAKTIEPSNQLSTKPSSSPSKSPSLMPSINSKQAFPSDEPTMFAPVMIPSKYPSVISSSIRPILRTQKPSPDRSIYPSSTMSYSMNYNFNFIGELFEDQLLPFPPIALKLPKQSKQKKSKSSSIPRKKY